MSEPTREMIERALRGDPGGAAELFRRYWRAARAAAFGVTAEIASAEDAASEAFREALGGLKSLRDPERFPAWLRTIAMRKARLERCRLQRSGGQSATEQASRGETPYEALQRLETAALVQRALRELPPAQREALALIHFEGYEAAAASRFLGIPEGSLRRRLHDGRRKLRIAMERISGGEPQMAARRKEEVERIRHLIESGAVFQGMKEAMTLRPPPRELLRPPARLVKAARSLLVPSEAALAGPAAVAIREFLARMPGTEVRVSRALLCAQAGSGMRTMFETVQACVDEQTFQSAMREVRFGDVIDLTWTAAAPLELSAVQDLLERMFSQLLPSAQPRFGPFAEPRYRSALEAYAGEDAARAVIGGVLASRPDTAHLRFFLDPWTAAAQ